MLKANLLYIFRIFKKSIADYFTVKFEGSKSYTFASYLAFFLLEDGRVLQY